VTVEVGIAIGIGIEIQEIPDGFDPDTDPDPDFERADMLHRENLTLLHRFCGLKTSRGGPSASGLHGTTVAKSPSWRTLEAREPTTREPASGGDDERR
jgi:hypothetical protein